MSEEVAPRRSLAPWINDDVEYYDHQITGVRTLSRMNSFLLGDEMGLGKSLQALTVFGVDVHMGYASKMLVVCPVTLKGNWWDEVMKFTRFDAVVLGIDNPAARKPRTLTPAERSEQIEEFRHSIYARLLICNYEQVKVHLDELNSLDFDVRCFDEAHYLKNPKAKRTEACLQVRARRTFLLTGSPMLNHVNELWTLMHMVSPHEYPDYYKFVHRYCLFGGYKEKQIIGVKRGPELTERLAKIMLRRLSKDVLKLKEPQIIQVKVGLTETQQTLYEEVDEELKLTTPGDPNPADIENALVKFLRLKQICGTAAAIEGYPDESYKLDRAFEIIAELTESGYKVVIFSQFRTVLHCIINRMVTKFGSDIPVWTLHGDIPKPQRQPTVNAWSAHEGPAVLACMIQVAGVGLNMTAARHAVFLDKLFTPEMNRQAIFRLNRIGQDETQPVQIYELLCRGTVETRVERILKEKRSVFEDTVETASFKRRLIDALMEEGDD